MPISTFLPGTPHRRLVEAFLDPDARLLVSDAETGGSPAVRVAHEALISHWERAREYVRSNAEALKIRHRIEERYALWRVLKVGGPDPTQNETPPSSATGLAMWRSRFGREQGLLTDIDLTDGRRLLREHRTDTESHLIAYIERSMADDKRLRTRSFRVVTGVASVVTLLAIVASAAGLVASRKQHEAEYQTAETLKAQSRLLTEAAAQRLKDSDMAGAQGIILEVLTNPDFAQTRTPAAISVFQEIRAADAQLAVLSGHAGSIESAAYSPDGTRIITASDDKTARIWDARTGAQLAVLSGHTGPVRSAAYSPDGTHIVTASDDNTARIWGARIPGSITAQILWDAAAETDPLPDVDRTQLGLLPDARVRKWSTRASACDQAAAAFYDPDRLAPGLIQATIVADVANAACSPQIAGSGNTPRSAYQAARALLARSDVKGARQQFELAVSGGYRAAQVDLANLLVDVSAGMLDPERAVALYQEAWRDGVPIASFELGHLYEVGIPGSDAAAPGKLQPDLAKAWAWYKRGADAGEPNALARFAERDEREAVGENNPAKVNGILLGAFSYYASAFECAHDEAWPEDASRRWGFRRATLARLLAREGMMQQVADAYQAIRDKWTPYSSTMWESIKAKLLRTAATR